ncbi:hypothetical protein UA08_06431 [Talaromyces atroroseus]|uniref:Uncharacterized protein n=1 Tax=Talaromyces atroroseus TaxID=1441469 RepID=A0A225ACM0_TALAT|nr:hypothetical protein UA08_06431 [Talaromyces atroroseus]OKL58130.1 hypothetical protein UA08_06431 [Talaromyces atroroseus]
MPWLMRSGERAPPMEYSFEPYKHAAICISDHRLIGQIESEDVSSTANTRERAE